MLKKNLKKGTPCKISIQQLNIWQVETDFP